MTKFSVIVAERNSRETLKACLDSVFSSDERDFEVIVVDDKSSDGSPGIVKGYPSCRLIALDEHRGAAFARNRGKEIARGDILVFIDGDVAIRRDTLGLINKSFEQNKDASALTGILSKRSPDRGFFTQYKNLYMHHIFKRCPKNVDFLFTSLAAFRRDSFLEFNERFKIGEDTELGQRYGESKKNILLDPKLEVSHNKRYNFITILKNDFLVPFWWARAFLLHDGLKSILKKRRFAHASMGQIASIAVSFGFLATFLFWSRPAAKAVALVLVILFVLLNGRFFSFLQRERGFVFLMKSVIFTCLDRIAMGTGVLTGLIYYSLFPWKEKT